MSRDDLDTPATVPLDRDEEVDVAIVGGGLSGLWTAWALTQADPSLSVAVFEAERLGFGASGRNGGWLSAKPVGIRDVLARQHGGRAGVLEIEQRLEESIHDVVDVLGAQNIDARHGGWMQVARSASEQNRIENYLAKSRSWGVDEGRLRLLTAAEASERVNIAGVTGALHSPDNYCVDPVKMLLALARTVQRAGVRIYTSSRVDTIEPGRLAVGAHSVRARRHVVVATEGYSSRQRGQRRRMLPFNSAMLVTDRLTDDQWEQIGWAHGDGVSGAAHRVIGAIKDHTYSFGLAMIPMMILAAVSVITLLIAAYFEGRGKTTTTRPKRFPAPSRTNRSSPTSSGQVRQQAPTDGNRLYALPGLGFV
ncbi:NAD(P)/FAD-dependent oxidoreductase [Rhodococcus sp. JVH1]